jgi:hypothetical protein
MRRALFLALSAVGAGSGLLGGGAGCASGSTAGSDDLTSDPVVALSDPGAKLPELGRSDDTSGADQMRVTPSAITTSKHLGSAGPSAITTCKKGAFCEDFEEPSPATRWTSTLTTAGTVDFPGPSSSLGAHALRAMTTGTGGVAYLTLDGATLGGQWVGVLGFSLRVDTLPTTTVGGPEIAVVDASGASTRIGFSVRPDGIALHQRFESCGGSACMSRSDLVSDVKPGEWRHLVVAIETYGTTTPPYGRIEVIVDGGGLIVLPLTVTPFDGKAEAHAGITVADAAPATARIDDVTFYAHSL